MHSCGPSLQRGLSLIELMIAAVLGLLIAAAATRLFAAQIDDHRRLLLVARLHQDLRAATSLVARDLRRAGYWQHALAATVAPAASNPYRAVSPNGDAATTATTYSFSRDEVENDTVDLNEATGFRLSAGSLQVLTGGSWQTLTDPAVLRVIRFSITPQIQRISLGAWCSPPCIADDGSCPALLLRGYQIQLQGRATADPTLVREVAEVVQMRNDELSLAACP